MVECEPVVGGDGVVRGLLAHRPQAVVAVEVAAGVTERRQVLGEQRGVPGLLAGDLQPVAESGLGQSREAPGRVERDVDRVGWMSDYGQERTSREAADSRLAKTPVSTAPPAG
jgi:hypothetical protein